MDFIVSFMPWWGWVAIALAVAGLVRVYTGSWKFTLAVLTFGLALAFQSRAYNKGWNAREQKGQKDAAKQLGKANAARRDAARRDADPGRLRNDDGFKRR